MSRKITLTPEEKRKNRERIEKNSIKLRSDESFISKLDKFLSHKRVNKPDMTRNKLILIMIKNNPEFKEFKPA